MLPFASMLLAVSLAPNTLPVKARVAQARMVTCDSVSRSRIEGALGQRLAGPDRQDTANESTCNYESANLAVTVSIRQLSEPLDLKPELANLKSAFPGSIVREIGGSSRRGFALELPGTGAQLHLIPEERVYIMISVLGASEEHAGLRAAELIARDLLGAQ